MDPAIETPSPASPTPPMFNVTSPEFTMLHYSSPFPLYGWLSILFPILRNPYIVESLRLFFFGSVLETCRRICRWALDRFTSGFFVTAHFQQGDWAFDWLSEFLAAQEIWTNSREYRVTVSNDQKEWALAPGGSSSTTKAANEKGEGAEDDTENDGYPRPLYFPASDNTQVIRWRGRWIQVTRHAGRIAYNSQTEEGASLSITIYTRKKKVLDDLVGEARQHYISTRKPPLAAQTGKKSNLTITATFEQSDYTFSWILEFLNTHNAWQNSNELIVTAKSDEQKWGMALGGNDRDGEDEGKEDKLRVYYQPRKENVHLWNWNGTWIQIQRNGGVVDYRTMKEGGGNISLTLFTGRKETLDELIAAAAEQYWSKSSRRVTVHMYESYRDWSITITKQIRPMDSLILPHGMSDLMISDLRDFIDNKDWYAAAGIPWRRGVLLWGPPGTGKSSTVHAIAGELQLEIYCVPLSSGDIDDSALQRLVAATPPNCILLLEDIDCGFRSRDSEGEDDDPDKPFNPYMIDTKKRVTLSGLLNVLDSVSSEEGRIVIATTNHIDKLDPALLRPGRMDLLVEYKLATRQQIIDLFARFYSRDLMIKTAKSTQGAKEPTHTAIVVSEEAASLVKKSDNSSFFVGVVPTVAEIAELAIQFADKVPESQYSIAQLQGYLLCSKRNPHGAIRNIDQWLADRQKEQADKEARLAKKAEEKAKWLKKEKFRQRKEKQMEEEMEKEMLAADEEAKKAENVQEKGDQDSGGVDERHAADDDLKAPDGASDKDSEPVIVDHTLLDDLDNRPNRVLPITEPLLGTERLLSQHLHYKKATQTYIGNSLHRPPPPPPSNTIMASVEQPSPTPETAFNATASEFVVPGFGTPLPLYSWLGVLLPMLNNPYIQESLRFFFLGSVLETGRRIFQWTLDRFTSGFFVTAHFQQGDWAFDWLNEFLAAQEIWTNSREYRVTASNVEKEWTCAPGASSSTDKTLTLGTGKGETGGDGFPRPLYFPASDMPQVLRWQGHWVQITRKAGVMAFNGQTEENAALTLTVYTRKKKVLDDLVEEARLYYISTQKPPLAAQTKKSNLTLKATFEQADYTYSWLLEFLNSHNAWQNSNEVIVTAKSAEQKWGMILGNAEERDEKLRAYYQPASQSQLLWNWNGTWIQVQRTAGSRDYRTGKEEGASISLTLFTGRKETLDELVAAAAEQYWERSSRRVTVHMCESYGDWGATITKQIRPMDSVILPHGMTDLMLDDLRDFMDNKDWYAAAGIPWRRGVLLWGPPGTGKSTTVHAIAGELQLEIYCVPLASNGIDDSSLQRLVASTPPNCILLLEDIDCAFPPRENEEDEADALSGQPFNPYTYGQAKSSVTLSGLLNLLDSVSSEEGRIVFATTNHIDRLDPALLRPGRMDLRIEYKNATRQQIIDLFSRFYSQELMTKSTKSTQLAEEAARKTVVVSDEAAALIKKSDNSSFLASVPTVEQVAELAMKFAEKVPENRYSIAQLQGYLLCSKRDPNGAVKDIDGWVADREKEQADKDARLAKRALERAKWLKMEKFRQKKEKQMEQDAEKEMLAEAEEADKLEKEMEAHADAEDTAEEKTEKKEDETKEDESKTADGASDKDSEPEIVESVTPLSSS